MVSLRLTQNGSAPAASAEDQFSVLMWSAAIWVPCLHLDSQYIHASKYHALKKKTHKPLKQTTKPRDSEKVSQTDPFSVAACGHSSSVSGSSSSLPRDPPLSSLPVPQPEGGSPALYLTVWWHLSKEMAALPHITPPKPSSALELHI